MIERVNSVIHKLHTSLLLNHACSSPHIPPPVTPPQFSPFAPVTMDEICRLLSDSPAIDYDLDPIPTYLLLLTPLITPETMHVSPPSYNHQYHQSVYLN